MASSDLRHNEPLLPIRAGQPRPGKQVLAAAIGSFLFLLSLIGLLLNNQQPDPQKPTPLSPEKSPPVSRGSPEGVSEKAFRLKSEKDGGPYPWTNAMLTWQRSGFHFQPQKNWMNDPDGPLYHMGWYHLFYQYNPDSAVWGNITWGHAVSKDLIHWLYLPISMVPDHWFDINGVWTGSATILPDGNIVMLYTGDTVNYVQVQNLAYPANLSDPLLLDWVKYSGNPVMRPPSGIKPKESRDPTTAWVGPDGIWRLTIGSKINGSGISLIYKTTNFTDYELTDVLHSVAGTGMWECLDFYPVSTTSGNGLNTSAYGPGTKHVLKASLDADKHDYYALGTYDPVTDKWIPDNPELDVGIGLRIDYGKYYASKTFYDQNKGRRILWGWVGETDTEGDDLLKGWASLQTIPREVTYDVKTGTNILQQPVEEVESLRLSTTQFNDVLLEPGSVVNLNITSATQLDVTAEFTVDSNALNTTVGADVIGKCSSAAVRGALGPFGLLVLADKSLSEQTPVYFYIAKATDGTLRNWFCTDQSRSTVANGVGKQVYGGQVPVLDDENYTMRLLVDHSIVEAFGQRGRTCITSRVYPTQAIYGAARVFLFNNATLLNVTASVTLSVMDSADIHSYPL